MRILRTVCYCSFLILNAVCIYRLSEKYNITKILINLRLCFKTENLFGTQFGELEKCI